MQRRQFISPRFHYTFGPHQPALKIEPGTSLRIVCPDSDNEWSDGTMLTPEQRQQDDGTSLFEGNPMAGPIFVEDAAPGDAIAVQIEAIHLDREKGQTGLSPAHGAVPRDLLLPPTRYGDDASVPRHLYRWRIDTVHGIARLENPLGVRPITVPLTPFVGCIGVCPEWGQSASTLFCGTFGGNMDIPLIRPGVTMYLPVFRAGGLLMMGDIHAAQGHGEIIGGAIETSGMVDCTIMLLKQRALTAPRVRDATQLAAIGIDGDLRGAVQRAYAHLVTWLADDFDLNRWDAYNLVSQTGQMIIGGINCPPYSAAACVPMAVLPEGCTG